jgi:hypothetical protein
MIGLVLLTGQLVQSQVLGVDLGSKYWKAAQIGPGKPFSIVEN